MNKFGAVINSISALEEGVATPDQQLHAASLIRKMLADINNLNAAYQEIVNAIENGDAET